MKKVRFLSQQTYQTSFGIPKTSCTAIKCKEYYEEAQVK